jgi:hypothetical protein
VSCVVVIRAVLQAPDDYLTFRPLLLCVSVEVSPMIVFKMFRMAGSCGLGALCVFHDAIQAMGGLYSGALLKEAAMLLRAGQSELAPIMRDALAWASDLLLLVLA